MLLVRIVSLTLLSVLHCNASWHGLHTAAAAAAANREEDPSTISASASNNVIDCEVRTLIFNEEEEGDDGNQQQQQHYKQQRCVLGGTANKGGGEMVYNLPEWISDKYSDQFANRPTNFLRIHGAHLASSSDQATKQRQGLRSNSNTAVTIAQNTISIDKNAKIEISSTPLLVGDNIRRRRRTTTGNKGVLIIRVSANDATVSLDAETISDRVFGPHASAASQYDACSMGRKQLVPAAVAGTTSTTNTGVLEVAINANIDGAAALDIENLVNGALVPGIDLESYSHIIYCLPRGSKSPSGKVHWKGFAYLHWNRAYFNDEYCGYLSHLVHELGHNLGLEHSGQSGGSDYADESGIMGYSYSIDQWPLMCFNAAKNWQLGWYDEKAIEVVVDDTSICGPWKGRLYGYPDFESIPDNDYSHVLIKVNDIYIQFNRIAEMNANTQDKLNVVAITQSPNDDGTGVSDLLAGLDVGDNWEYDNLRVDICSKQTENGLEYYDIVIRDKSQPSICDGGKYASSECGPVVDSSVPAAAPWIAPPAESPRTQPSCGDDMEATFLYVDEANVEHQKSCAWLQTMSADGSTSPTTDELCLHGHPAYSLCEETCGKCRMACHDTPTTFEHDGADRDCEWLFWNFDTNASEDLCKRSHDSYRACPDTCGGCAGIPAYPVPLSLAGHV